MSHNIAPPLTRAGFLAGCSQPGPVTPMMKSINLGNVCLTFTKDGIILSSENESVLERLLQAKELVGNRSVRITAQS